jgi:peptide chain release factor subunit 1
MALTEQLERLAAFDAAPYPVVSLYLNTQPDQHGRDQHQAFIRREFKARSRTYPANSPERESLDKDLERIGQYLENELQPSANGVAIFACSAGELFEAIQLAAPIDQHWLYISDQPHLYPLARLESQYPRCAAVLVDTNTARIFVFAQGEVVAEREVQGIKTRGTSQGGWSQARFQRHLANFHLQHAKEVVEVLERIVAQEGIDTILVAGDEVITPRLREQMPKSLLDKVVDHVRLGTQAPVGDVLNASLEAMRKLSDRTDREKVDTAVGNFRAGGLGVVGPEDTLAALIKGQVDELLITASMGQLQGVKMTSQTEALANDSAIAEPAVETVSAGGEAPDAAPEVVRLADELITRAKQTGATVTFVEDPSLLQPYGGVAALLRFTI